MPESEFCNLGAWNYGTNLSISVCPRAGELQGADLCWLARGGGEIALLRGYIFARW